MSRLAKWIRSTYIDIVSSIAFYPAIIAICFLLISWLMLELDFSALGKHIKSSHSWIRLKDASTARSIVSTIAGGIISLMVFSFSMVMILLNQAASQMSNRMLESMIGNRFQQLVLGTYIGTIVYSLFLLSTIRDIESGIYVPALSIYLLVLLTIIDIFTFIYFLHYVTQSAKFETIIERVLKQTMESLEKSCNIEHAEIFSGFAAQPQFLLTKSSGTYQGFDLRSLCNFIYQNNGTVEIVHPPGTYLLPAQTIIKWYGPSLSEEKTRDLLVTLDFYAGQPVKKIPYYGFHQLAEVALKALSPGINDPETAVLSLKALASLFAYRLAHHPKLTFENKQGEPIILIHDRSFETLFDICILPIWDYGKKDRYVQNALIDLITQLQQLDVGDRQHRLFEQLLTKIRSET